MTNAAVTVRARVNPELKAEVEGILEDIGLTMSDAINLMLRAIRNTHSLPFPLTARVPNAETAAVIRDVQKRRNLTPSKGFDAWEASVLAEETEDA